MAAAVDTGIFIPNWHQSYCGSDGCRTFVAPLNPENIFQGITDSEKEAPGIFTCKKMFSGQKSF